MMQQQPVYQQQQPVYQQPQMQQQQQQQPVYQQQQPVYQQPQMQQQQQPQMTQEEYNAYVAQQAQQNINQIQNAAMKNPNNAGFVPLSQTTVTAQPMGFNASAPNIPPQVQQNKENLTNIDTPEMVNNFKRGLERMVNNMFGNNDKSNVNAQVAAAQMAAMQQAQAQQQTGFFNTGWGKAALVGTGIGVGIIGTKIFSSNDVNQQDVAMLADAGKTLSDASIGDITKALFG